MEDNKTHILVVDDDNRIRSLLKEFLNENDYIVSTSKDAEDAKIKITHLLFDRPQQLKTYQLLLLQANKKPI